MKYQQSDRMLEIANKVAKMKGVKSLLKPIYYPYKRYMEAKRNRFFLQNGKDILQQFNAAMRDGDYFYTLAFGTMLGAVREKGFIKHDLDIDVYMWNEDWSPALRTHLQKHGFELIHNFLVDNGASGREETYAKDNISIDIFYLYPPINEYPYCCDFLMYPGTATFRQSIEKYGGLIARRIELPIKKERVLTQFEGLSLYIPSNYDEILSFRYGPDYMIPNPKWSFKSHNNHIIVWEGKQGTLAE